MNVTLSPELERFVQAKLKTGQYASASDVVSEALTVLKEQEEFSPTHEAYLRREIDRGLEELDRGELSNFTAETVIAEERARLAKQQGRG